MRRTLWLAALPLALAACDGPRDRPAGTPRDATTRTDTGTTTTDAGDSGVADTGTMDTGVMDTGVAMVPDPGTEMNSEWTDVEPNDDPSTAVPQGILTGPVWMGFVMPFTTINTDTDVDFFVFKTGPAATDLENVFVAACWGDGVNLLDMYLYSVENGLQGAQVLAAESTDTSCETLIDFGQGPTTLTADTTYLLEVRAAPGLALGGNGGMYSA